MSQFWYKCDPMESPWKFKWRWGEVAGEGGGGGGLVESQKPNFSFKGNFGAKRNFRP